MQDLFGKWYVPRAEYAKMMELHAMEIADLRAQLEQLRSALSFDAICSLDDFQVEHFAELPPVPLSSNVVSVDFRHRRPI